MRRLPILLLLAAVSCSDGPVALTMESVGSVRVDPERVLLTTGDSMVVGVRVFDTRGQRITSLPPDLEPVVSASDPAVLEIRGDRAVAVGSGPVDIVASIGEVTGAASIRVNPAALSISATVLADQVALPDLHYAPHRTPLIEGRPGLIRIVVTADRANFFPMPSVRVRLFLGEEELSVEELHPQEHGIPRPPLDEDAPVAGEVHLPAELVRPGLGVLLEIDLEGALPLEGGEAPVTYPPSGDPLRLHVVEVPEFRIRFIPIHHPGIGTGNVTPGNVDDYLSATRALYPLNEVDAEVGAPYTPQIHPDSTDYWVGLVSEVSMLRAAEGSDRYYYGIAEGTTGRAYIGHPVSVSHDDGWLGMEIAAGVVAHELGHNFGRRHAGPCRPNDPYLDPDYPYAGGTIGVRGYDAATRTSFAPDGAFDVMGRCGRPEWVSDYTFRAVFDFRRSRPFAGPDLAAGDRTFALLVWGRADESGIRLEPAFQVETRPTPPDRAGAYTAEGFDDGGALLFSHPFDPVPVAHEAAGTGAFALAVPLDFPVDRLARVRVRGGGHLAESRSVLDPAQRAALRTAGGAAAGEEALRGAADEVEVRWDPARHPAALIFDPGTGRVLGYARDGSAQVVSDASELEVLLSDGVSSVARRVRPR